MALQRAFIAIVALSLAIPGCLPGTYVKKNPGKRDKGIRYYRPKPYLFVSPSGETKLDKDGKPASISPSDRFVNIELKYLPDFSEEYSVRVVPGIGAAEVSMTLTDGWNLTAINQKLDSKIPENINALANLTKAIAPGGLVGTSGTDGTSSMNAAPISVAARNIPLGFYESVIGEDQCGKKQLYGWRYIGFAPFNGCPTYATGACSANCQDGTLQLYGLVFENEVMMFKQLAEIAMIPGSNASYRVVQASAVVQAPASEAETDFDAEIATVKTDIANYFSGEGIAAQVKDVKHLQNGNVAITLKNVAAEQQDNVKYKLSTFLRTSSQHRHFMFEISF